MSALTRRPEIDGLRAIAVVAVVLYHADPRLMPGGFVGVDVFFVISGYLITALLAGEWRRTGRIDFAHFYARRVRRLLPALVLVVVATMVATVLLLGRQGDLQARTGDSAVAGLAMVANIHFQLRSGGYFQETTEALPLLHLWSLSVEEQYYLVYPALLALLLRRVPGGVVRRLAVLSVLSLLLAEYWVHILPERAFFQTPARFWELAVGAMVALSTARQTPHAGDRWWLPLGLAAVAAACFFTPRWGSFPGIGAAPAVLGTAAVLLGSHRQAAAGVAASLLRSRPFVAVGLVSYSLYLWHWPLLAIDANLRLEPAPTAWRLALCAISLAIAGLSWRYVEMPFRKARGVSPRGTLLAGLAASLLAIGAVLALAGVDRIPPGDRLISEFARQDKPGLPDGCHWDFQDPVQALAPARCHSRPGIAPTVALWGDSHAYAWQPFAWHLAGSAGLSAAAVTKNSCVPSGRPPAAPDSEQARTCAALNELALRWFESGDVQTVVIGLRWPLVVDQGGTLPASIRERVDGLEAALGRMRGVPRVLVMGPLPGLKRPGPTCIAAGWQDECAASRAAHEERTTATWRALEGLAARHANVELVDPTDFFCSPTRCRVTRDGYGLYWDGNHISATASRAFAAAYLADPARYTRLPRVGARPTPGP